MAAAEPEVRDPDAASMDGLSLSSPSDRATFTNISLDGDTEETAVPPPTATRMDIREDAGDADVIVLGFQELDLSTEALLYSTSTAREDAWCEAVFAGLGEKAVLYEKVRPSVAVPSHRDPAQRLMRTLHRRSSRPNSSSGCSWSCSSSGGCGTRSPTSAWHPWVRA